MDGGTNSDLIGVLPFERRAFEAPSGGFSYATHVTYRHTAQGTNIDIDSGEMLTVGGFIASARPSAWGHGYWSAPTTNR